MSIFQRNAIVRGIDRLPLNDRDIIIISDLDEIPDPRILSQIRDNKISVEGNSMELDLYYYNLNSKYVNKWYFCKIVSYNTFKNYNKSCETIRNTNFPPIYNSGWHLSYFGDTGFIQNKISNFSHQELNLEEFKDKGAIEEKIRNCTDLYGRSYVKFTFIPLKDNDYLPPQYDTYLNKFILQ